MNTSKSHDYYALDDIGFIGDPDYRWTDEDTAFFRQFFAEHKATRPQKSVASTPTTKDLVMA
jgi:hypothetical protein